MVVQKQHSMIIANLFTLLDTFPLHMADNSMDLDSDRVWYGFSTNRDALR